ncbi:hypothetical protein V492_05063 [Pseudogymnoascus sp. VKM F-4246]|nr:hypothetical protein V492_05063 [Pseudogymnoascus sp. VKM F-4246]
MGSSASKPASTAPSHVWQSETPVRFSQELVDSLQSSTETDSTRANTLELHVQARVAEELKRLQAREESTLAALLEAEKNEATPDAASSAESSAGDTLRGLGRESVAKDVAKLRERLEQRKKMREVGELDQEVDRARGEVVKCLRGNDTRPLDCWREVKAFREGVARLEGGWVEKVVN